MAKSKKTTEADKVEQPDVDTTTPEPIAAEPELVDVPTDEAPVTEEPQVEDAEVIEETAPDADEGAEAASDTETAEDTAPEETPEPAPAPMPTPEPQKSGGFMGTIAGGVVAAVIGFGGAQVLGPDFWIFGSDTGSSEITDDLSARIDQIGDDLSVVQKKLDEAPAPTAAEVDMDAIRTDVEGLVAPVTEQIAALSARLDALDARLVEVENRPAGAVAPAANQAELDELRAALDAQQAKNEELSQQVATAAAIATAEIDAVAAQAKQTEANAALLRVTSALESGAPFASALDVLAGVADVPAALSDVAANGVPTVATLTAAFADPARAALSASLREDAGDDAGSRLSAFLRTQLGARSLAPREGDDPDAILSRAEAAVAADDLTTALAEIAALPEGGQAAMADWVAAAETRLNAIKAADALAATLNAK